MFISKRNYNLVSSVFDCNVIELYNKLHNPKRLDGTLIFAKRFMRVRTVPRKAVERSLDKHKMSDGNLKKSNKLFSKAECGCIPGSQRNVGSGSHPGSSNVQRGSDGRDKTKESIEACKNLPKCNNFDLAKKQGSSNNVVQQHSFHKMGSKDYQKNPSRVRKNFYNAAHIRQPDTSIQQATFLSSCFTQGVNVTSLHESSHFFYRSISDSSYLQNLSNMCFNSSQYDGGRIAKSSRAASTTRNTNVLRTWKHTSLGKILDKKRDGGKTPGVIFKIISYNVLAQDLLVEHPYLYAENEQNALTWEHRWRVLFQEIKDHDCDIVCLQEVQQSHIENHFNVLKLLGYKGVYKKRTGMKTDGCAIYYKKAIFRLVEHVNVEYSQPNIPLLDRENVAIVAKLAPRSNLSAEFVVATTHLLYNPKRVDIRLAQTQVLLTEVERIAYKGEKDGAMEYLPVIITGDLNSTPDSAVNQFIRNGRLKYENAVLRSNHGVAGKVLIPPFLRITDDCQHADLIKHRQTKTKLSRSEEHKLIRLKSSQQPVSSLEKTGMVSEGKFASGTLSHPFRLTSVYSHVVNNDTEGTTYQGEWITVDYIFYSGMLDEARKFRDEKLKLLSQYTLPTSRQLTYVRIPNLELGSDHLALLAKFKLEY